jgi:DNA-binding CsgD family transcriptional regulator
MQQKKESEMHEQKERFQADAKKIENEIIALKNQQLQYELRHKSQELASSTMNLIRKNEILLEINGNIEKIFSDIKEKDVSELTKKLGKMQQEIKLNIEQDDNWKKFAENFDIVYENYLKHMGERYPNLTISDKKLCAYLRMGLRSKDIAPLLNMSFRSVEMSRYRLRKKLDIDRDINLTDFLQNFK